MKSGQQLSHYRLLDKIGEGGMGVVWKSLDTSLNREVAIKVLPEALAADVDRLARFEREARVLAALNHPNIAAIYGLHSEDEARFLAMELVPGEDLARRIRQTGALPLSQVLDVGRQIADALEAAHASGIVHRDLKPANVMLTPEGRVKVLDFGLAKAVAGDATSGNPSLSPTLTSAGTLAGMILGTAAYMSPEQARGHVADRRSDLWALGCVLYEMLTGKMAFGGDTVSDTLASVLKLEPDLRLLPADTPRALRRLLRRCLEKDANRRLHDAADARLEIEEAANAPAEEALPAAAGGRSWLGSPWLLLGVAALSVAAGVLFGRALAPEAPDPPVRRFFVPVSDGEVDASSITPLISPDGSRIAYTVASKLFVRDVDRTQAHEIEGVDGAYSLFWSSDGRHLGFAASRKLWKVEPEKGQPELICELTGSVRGVNWRADDTIIMIVDGNEIHTVPARGGDPVRLAVASDDDLRDYHGLATFPDGQGFVVIAHLKSGPNVLEFRSGDRREVLLSLDNPLFQARYAQPGYLLFSRREKNAGLWALPVSRDGSKAVGDPQLLLPSVYTASASADGTLVYVEGSEWTDQQVVWAATDGTVLSAHGQAHEGINDLALSPDGTIAVVVGKDGEDWNLWLHDLEGKATNRLTFGEGEKIDPTWSPDGAKVFYAVTDTAGAEPRIFSIAADGSGNPWPVETGRDPVVSDDGTTLVFARDVETTESDVFWKRLDDEGEAQAMLNTAAREYDPALSRDGKFLAYVSDESGRREVYITAFPSAQGRWQASTDGGVEPQWSPDGDAVYFEWGRRVFKVEIARRGDGLALSSPVVLLDGRAHGLLPWDGYHVAPDGRRVLTVRNVEEDDAKKPAAGIHVVENWPAAFGG